MGRPEKYEPAHRQLRMLLAESREEGLDFDAAWDRAVRPGCKLTTTSTAHEDRPDGCVVWPADTRDRQLIRVAVLEGKDAWRRGYDREPETPAERALMRLFSELRLESDGEHDRSAIDSGSNGRRGPSPANLTHRPSPAALPAGSSGVAVLEAPAQAHQRSVLRGRCVECHEPIEVGEEIVQVRPRKWAHANC